MYPGMMAIFDSLGVMMPGQLGPMRRTFELLGELLSSVITLAMSRAGMPSVMQTIKGT